jgi:hypothetical protein
MHGNMNAEFVIHHVYGLTISACPEETIKTQLLAIGQQSMNFPQARFIPCNYFSEQASGYQQYRPNTVVNLTCVIKSVLKLIESFLRPSTCRKVGFPFFAP